MGNSYAVFRIDGLESRDDWESLSSIQEPFLQAIEMLNSALIEPDADKQKAMADEAQRRLGPAKLAAYRSKDLTKVAGRRQVIDALQRKFDEAKHMFGLGASAPLQNFTLSRAMAVPIPYKEVVALGDMDESELYLNVQ